MWKKLSLPTLIIIVLQFAACNNNTPVAKQKAIPMPQNNIRSYLTRVAAEITDNSLSNINTKTDWENIKGQRHKEFIEMMGIQDYYYKEHSNLNLKITGSIQKEGYHIEKLYYESLPGLYVPANLYIPDNIEKPTAAILYVCGHSPTQKVRYQPYPRKFAELGFVCLVIETIQWGEVKGDHWGCYANGWFNWYSRGYNPGGVELWNAIRGLDLLASRPEVDAEKMGVTGISGGGSQSWYIAAADKRIKAAAPVCGASTLKAQIGQRTVDGHCDCMMPTNTYQIDFQDIGALIAPRALLIAQANRDGLNTIESAEELYTDIKKMYDLYTIPENISLVETPGGHSYHQISREKIHSFFLDQLMGKKITPNDAGDIDTSKENMLPAEKLQVYIDGVPKNDKTIKIQDSFVQLPSPPAINTENELIEIRDSVKEFLMEKTFGAFPNNKIPLNPKMEFRSLDGAKYGWNIYSFDSEEGWRLNVDLRWKNDPSEKKPLMIVLRNYDEERWESEAFISNLQNNWNIAYLEVRGVGENGWDPGLQWHVRRASAWTGRTIASMQVYDALRCMEYCRTLKGVDPNKIGIAAKDEMSTIALYAALLDGNCTKLILSNPPETQNLASQPNGKGAATEMLNCLRITDLYQIPALIFPTEISFSNDPPKAYQWSEKIINKLGGKFTQFNE